MKVKLQKTKKLPSFEPIQLTITIESQDELIEFWHRLNIAPDNVKKYNKRVRSFNSNMHDLWDILDETAKKHNISMFND